MKKIFIVLFVLLASSVYAEIETIFDYSYYTKEGEKETISLEVFEDEDEEDKYLLRVFHYGENFQIVYGIFLGFLTVILRYLTSAPEGVLTSILIMNMFVIILDRIGARARFDLKKISILILTQFVLVLGLSLYIAEAKKNNVSVDQNFSIVSKEKSENKVTYIATQKGYSSTIKAKVIISDGTIEDVEILEQNDSFYSKVLESNYISKFKNQKNVDNIDTVSGATITSNAIKKLINNVLNDYKR